MSFGERFLDPRRFSNYAQSLAVVDSSFQDSLLQFLERERLLLPACRVHLPPEVHRRLYLESRGRWVRPDPTLEVESDDDRCRAAAQLLWELDMWGGSHPRAPSTHPLDAMKPDHASFVMADVGQSPFRPWRDFSVRMGITSSGNPISDSDLGTRTYYHYHQVFVLAEILDTGLHVLFDLNNEEVARAIDDLNLALVAGRCHSNIRLAGGYALKDFPVHRDAFEAVAFYVAYRQQAWNQAFRHKVELRGSEAAALSDREVEIARYALHRWNVTPDQLLAMIRWGCGQWADWDRRASGLASDHRKNVRAAVEVLAAVTGKSGEEIVGDVGRVTGHFRPTLEAMFPDREKELRDDAVEAFKSWVSPLFEPLRATRYAVTAADGEAFVDWLVARHQLQLLAHIGRMNELSHHMDRVTAAARAQELVALAVAIEHILVQIAETSPSRRLRNDWFAKCQKETMGPRLKWLWLRDRWIAKALNEPALVDLTKERGKDLRDQLNGIARVRRGGKCRTAVQMILRTLLVRNFAAHRGFVGQELGDLIALFQHLLAGGLLIWKRATVVGLAS